MLNIKMLQIKKVDGFESLRAFADISINDGDITIKGLRIIQDEKGLWVGYPQSKYQKNGQTKYSPIVEVSEDIKKHFQQVILEAYQNS